MNLRELYLSGKSKSRFGFLKNFLRKIVFILLRPYFKSIVFELEQVIARCGANSKDLEAMGHRFNTIEFGLGEYIARNGGSYNKGATSSFSQVGEDRIVSYIFERLGMPLSDVRYLDLGSAFPIGSNNTYLFYLNGSSGCLIDADPLYFPEYKRLRPRDMAIHAAIVPKSIADKDATVTIYRTADPGWSTVSKTHLEMAKAMGKTSNEIQSIEVPAKSIADILMTIDFNVDFLSIDIEGLDSDVVREFDLSDNRPKVIVIENLFDNKTNSFESDIRLYLESCGYDLFGSTYVNSIFIDGAVLKNLKF